MKIACLRRLTAPKLLLIGRKWVNCDIRRKRELYKSSFSVLQKMGKYNEYDKLTGNFK